MKILCVTTQIESASSLYRAFGPLSELHRIDPTIQADVFQSPFEFNLLNLKGYDIVLLHNPDQEWQLEAVYLCKSFGIKVIVDYDDNFFAVEEDNPYHVEMKERKINYYLHVKRILEKADSVIVSTDALAKAFQDYNNKITVIRNAFDPYIHKLAQDRNKAKMMVLWRGRTAHKNDLSAYEEQISKLVESNKDFTFVFWGLDPVPTWLQDLGVRCRNICSKPVVHAYSYFYELAELAPSLTIVPLIDNEFNRCKSDIAKLESIAAGSLCISPEWHEWSWCTDAVKFDYSNKVDFFDKTNGVLELIRNNDESLDRFWRFYKDNIKTRRMLYTTNEARISLFEEVICG